VSFDKWDLQIDRKVNYVKSCNLASNSDSLEVLFKAIAAVASLNIFRATI